jgi:hypothetical protein
LLLGDAVPAEDGVPPWTTYMVQVPPGKLVNVAVNPPSVEMLGTVRVGVGGGGGVGDGAGFGDGLGLAFGVGDEAGRGDAVGVERGAPVGRAVGVARGVAPGVAEGVGPVDGVGLDPGMTSAIDETTTNLCGAWQDPFQQMLTV